MPKIEFLFDFGSPNAYLSHLVIPGIEKRHGVKFDYLPVLLGGVFKLTNNRSPAETNVGIKNKPQYQQLETDRFRSEAARREVRLSAGPAGRRLQADQQPLAGGDQRRHQEQAAIPATRNRPLPI